VEDIVTPRSHRQAAVRGRIARRIRVSGLVQGVGFRPFVASLAARLRLGGSVRNDGHGVVIEVEGAASALANFLEGLAVAAPPLALVERIEPLAVPARGRHEFVILQSDVDAEPHALVSPDVGTCDDCLRELFDPADRRFEHPFISCTNCGPRFTIVRDVPYDRERTTMAPFPMCRDCALEYHDPADRRFHAQPLCCPACGPQLRLSDRSGASLRGDPLTRTAELLGSGYIVAVKGLGGYHLAVLAADESAVAALRVRKGRDQRPFAVMVSNLAAARHLAHLEPMEAAALASPRRPIVLCRRRTGGPIADSVAPGNRHVGLLLPYTPLHHLLCHRLRFPFVLTSGNVSEEPIAYTDGDARKRLETIADFFLAHDRPIHARIDDSVVRIFHGHATPVRRGRGYAPQPLLLARAARRPILACGAEVKNTFCLVRDRYAFLSPHIGDLENWRTLRSFTTGIEHARRLFRVAPELVAFDLHPEYLSTKFALALEGMDFTAVQHHHAHVASCLADNGEEGPVIGVAFDGLGYGTDGTFWGGECIVANLLGFTRAAHLETVPMPGATAAIREPWRMAVAWLAAAFGEAAPAHLDVAMRNRSRWETMRRLASARMTPRTSSAGRLFDAVAAILGVRDVSNYEGQAAVELEQKADASEDSVYPVSWSGTAPMRIHGTDLIRAVVQDLTAAVPVPIIAARFHNGLAAMIAGVCAEVRVRTGLSTVALSGGVFQNVLLLERTMRELERAGFRVLVHRRVPCNDGGISFGQAVVASARDRGA
jgi:hydrogenase maturation protein HypF